MGQFFNFIPVLSLLFTFASPGFAIGLSAEDMTFEALKATKILIPENLAKLDQLIRRQPTIQKLMAPPTGQKFDSERVLQNIYLRFYYLNSDKTKRKKIDLDLAKTIDPATSFVFPEGFADSPLEKGEFGSSEEDSEDSETTSPTDQTKLKFGGEGEEPLLAILADPTLFDTLDRFIRMGYAEELSPLGDGIFLDKVRLRLSYRLTKDGALSDSHKARIEAKFKKETDPKTGKKVRTSNLKNASMDGDDLEALKKWHKIP